MKVPKKILIRSPNWIGDQILAYPFFHYLREAYPSAKITVACVPWVQAIQFRNLIDEVFILPRPMNSSFFNRWDAIEKGARMMRVAGSWDLGICLPDSFSSAWFLFRSHVQVRRGYNKDGRRFLLNQVVAWNSKETEHRSESYVALLPELKQLQRSIKGFWGIPADNDLDPGIAGVLSSFDAERAWPDAEAFDPPEKPFWILAPGATAESRRWSEDQFTALAYQISQETQWEGVIIGGAAESSLAMRLADNPSLRLSDWTGRGTVSSYWKLFRKAKFSVCNDSGLAHVAALCGSPVQVVWGAGDLKRTEPLGPGKVQVIFNPVDCWPCERNTCLQPPEKKLDCLKGISSDAVWNSIKTGIRPSR